ncbi:hypothetical protein MMC22_003274 [Lobaria immixta]|nr:hypothetical protein [Lobaria immixta]
MPVVWRPKLKNPGTQECSVLKAYGIYYNISTHARSKFSHNQVQTYVLRNQFNHREPPQLVFSCQFIRLGLVDQVFVLHVFYSSVYFFTLLIGLSELQAYLMTFEVLLRRNLDIDFEGEIYRNVLEKASSKLYVGPVEMLLNRMEERNVTVEAYGNALGVTLKAVAENKAETKEDDKGYWSHGNHGTMIEMLAPERTRSS